MTGSTWAMRSRRISPRTPDGSTGSYRAAPSAKRNEPAARLTELDLRWILVIPGAVSANRISYGTDRWGVWRVVPHGQEEVAGPAPGAVVCRWRGRAGAESAGRDVGGGWGC